MADWLAEAADRNIRRADPLMEVAAAEIRGPAIEQPLVSIRSPAAGRDQLSIKVVLERNHVDRLRIERQRGDFLTQRGRNDFVTVDGENPVVPGECHCGLMRTAEAGERAFELMQTNVR